MRAVILLLFLLLAGLASALAPNARDLENAYANKDYATLLETIDRPDLSRAVSDCDKEAYRALAYLALGFNPHGNLNPNGNPTALEAVFQNPAKCSPLVRAKLEGALSHHTLEKPGHRGFVVTAGTQIRMGDLTLQIESIGAQEVVYRLTQNRGQTKTVLCRGFQDLSCRLNFEKKSLAGARIAVRVSIKGALADLEMDSPKTANNPCKTIQKSSGDTYLVLAYSGYKPSEAYRASQQDMQKGLLLLRATLGQDRFSKLKISYYVNPVVCEPHMTEDTTRDRRICDVSEAQRACGADNVHVIIKYARENPDRMRSRGSARKFESNSDSREPALLRHEVSHLLFGLNDAYEVSKGTGPNVFADEAACKEFIRTEGTPNNRNAYSRYISEFRTPEQVPARPPQMDKLLSITPNQAKKLLNDYGTMTKEVTALFRDPLTCARVNPENPEDLRHRLAQRTVMYLYTTPAYSFSEWIAVGKALQKPSPTPKPSATPRPRPRPQWPDQRPV